MSKNFVLKLLGLTLLLAVLTAGFLYFKNPGEDAWFWSSIGFYLVLGFFIGYRTQKAVTSESNSKFFTGVMGSIGLRLFLSILFLAIYLMVSELKSKEFIVFYLILYLFYTIFEISQLVSKLRAEKSSSIDNTNS